MSYRGRDISVEKEVNEFLDHYFYPIVCEEFFRYTVREDQLKGKDIMISIGPYESIVVDEKAATHYINKDLKTFAFELNFISQSKRKKGWLFDEKKETEYYFLMWLESDLDDNWHLKKENITLIKGLLLSRAKLIEYLNAEGFTIEELDKKVELILDENKKGRIFEQEHEHVCYYHSPRYSESPVNLIIDRSILEQLCEYRFWITKEKVVGRKPLQKTHE